jgi:hypothetical protein
MRKNARSPISSGKWHGKPKPESEGELFDLAGRLDRMAEETTPTVAAGSRTSGKAISSMATALPASTARY